MVAKVTSQALALSPRGIFNGATGDLYRKYALGTTNGLDSTNGIVCNGTTCTVTYASGVPIPPVGAPITVWGTNTALDNGRAMSGDYIVNSGAGSTSYTFNSTIGAGNYTHNDHCGPGASPNGTIQGTDNCVRVSQVAVAGNPIWVNMYSVLAGLFATNAYMHIMDDGRGQIGYTDETGVLQQQWGPAGAWFLVDQSSTVAAAAVNYMLTHVTRIEGAGFIANENYGDGGSDFSDYAGGMLRDVSVDYMAGVNYLSSAQKTLLLAHLFNDYTDPTPCTQEPIGQNVLAIGISQGGSGNTITLSAADSAVTNYYKNSVVEYVVGTKQFGVSSALGYRQYGAIGSNDSTTKVLTLNPSSVSMTGATYVSGGTVVGGAGTWCQVTFTGGGGSGASALYYVLNPNNSPPNFGNAFAWQSYGNGFTSAPTQATFSNNSAACSGTITITSTISGWKNEGITPTVLSGGTYTSGITAVGTAGQTCNLASFNGGGSGATATVALTGTNTIASGTQLTFLTVGGAYGGGTDYTTGATSATATNGTAACSGTATVVAGTAYTIFSSIYFPSATAQATSSSSITLTVGDPAATNYYNNFLVNANGSYSVVSAYNSATKVATVGTWSAGTPTSNTVYQILTPNGSGTAQAGSSSTITLAAGDTRPNNWYFTAVIKATVGGNPSYGLVSQYNGTTKVATVASWSNGAPSNGTAYQAYMPVVEGFNTDFIAEGLAYQDAVIGNNGWQGIVGGSRGAAFIGSVDSSTQLSVIYGGQALSGSANIFAGEYYSEKNQLNTGAYCGAENLHSHWSGATWATPLAYGATGGQTGAANTVNTAPAVLSNNGSGFDMGRLALDSAAADDDTRALADFQRIQVSDIDYHVEPSMAYFTGLTPGGAGYGWNRHLQDTPEGAWMMKQSIPGMPSMDLGGGWIEGASHLKTYMLMSPTPYSLSSSANMYWGVNFGGSAGGPTAPRSTNLFNDPGSYMDPTASSSAYFQSIVAGPYGGNALMSGGIVTVFSAMQLNPSLVVPALNYTSQPLQYAFITTSGAACATFYGGTCPYDVTQRGDAIISRTGWASQSDSWLFVRNSAFIGDHDNPQPNMIQFVKKGFLLAPDELPIGNGDVGGYQNWRNVGQAIDLGQNLAYPLLPASITNWASANHGSWSTNYGDQNSAFAAVKLDTTQIYQTPPNKSYSWVVHLKKPGAEEILVQYKYMDTANNPSAIRDQVHFPQNGETVNNDQYSYNLYNEGTTTCSSLNTSHTVLEQETGLNDGYPNDVTNDQNLITNFITPNGAPTLFYNCDGTAYPYASGHTYRVSICADPTNTGACGYASATKLEDLVVYKVATQPDTTLTLAAVDPDGNWTGFQSADKLALFSRSGVNHGTMTSFTRTLSASTTQVLYAGVTSGTYTPKINGTAVTTCNGATPPCTVTDGDNTIYFETTVTGSAVFTLPGTPNTCTLTTASLPGGSLGVSYSQTPTTTNCTAPNTWAITAGSLPTGLSLNSSTGAITGTPSGAITNNSFTLQVTDTLGNPSSASLSINIDGSLSVSPSSWSAACTIGGGNPPNQALTLTAVGGSLGAWTDTSSQTWLTTSAASGSGNGSINGIISCTGLAAGLYSGTVTVNATGATNNPQTAGVTLVVNIGNGPGAGNAGAAASAGTVKK